MMAKFRKMVSVIITTHNRCSSLRNAIQSVKKQTYRNLEIIVIDDASTDGTQEMCKKIKGIRYQRIHEKEPCGANHARNVGIFMADGEYIAFLDDDDRWHPDKLKMQMREFEADADVGMVYCGLLVSYGKKRLSYAVYFDPDAKGDLVQKQCFWHPFCTTSAMVVKKAILEEAGCFDENVAYWQEYELSLRLIQKCRVALVNGPYVLWNRSIENGSQMTNQYGKWEDAVKYIDQKHRSLFEKLDKLGRRRKLENYYKEAAYRAAAVGKKGLMKEFYRKAYLLTWKPEYFIRWKWNLSRQDTIYLEIFLKKVSCCVKKMIIERKAVHERAINS